MWPLQFFKAMQLHCFSLDSAELDVRAERDASALENEVGAGRGSGRAVTGAIEQVLCMYLCMYFQVPRKMSNSKK